MLSGSYFGSCSPQMSEVVLGCLGLGETSPKLLLESWGMYIANKWVAVRIDEPQEVNTVKGGSSAARWIFPQVLNGVNMTPSLHF